jgi:hypothetical protein
LNGIRKSPGKVATSNVSKDEDNVSDDGLEKVKESAIHDITQLAPDMEDSTCTANNTIIRTSINSDRKACKYVDGSTKEASNDVASKDGDCQDPIAGKVSVAREVEDSLLNPLNTASKSDCNVPSSEQIAVANDAGSLSESIVESENNVIADAASKNNANEHSYEEAPNCTNVPAAQPSKEAYQKATTEVLAVSEEDGSGQHSIISEENTVDALKLLHITDGTNSLESHTEAHCADDIENGSSLSSVSDPRLISSPGESKPEDAISRVDCMPEASNKHDISPAEVAKHSCANSCNSADATPSIPSSAIPPS